MPTVVRKRAWDVADRAAPIAKQAVPIAKQAGIAARQSAEDAVAWAAPRVDEARSWVAPRIERTGIAVRDSIAPRISDALVTAAHKVDASPSKRRRWPRVMIGFTLLAAIAGAVAAAIARRNRPDPFAAEPPSEAADIPAPQATDEQGDRHEANGSQPAEAKAEFRTS